jgi:hypothetical protein
VEAAPVKIKSMSKENARIADEEINPAEFQKARPLYLPKVWSL